jgi:hypothetical protein
MNARANTSTDDGLQVAGVNIGFGFVKVAAGQSTDAHLRLASVVREVDRSLAWHRRPTGVVRVRWEGLEYEVGEEAVLYGTGHQLKALHREWVDTLAYQVLAQSVVDWLARRGPDWSVVVGLAFDHFRDEAYRRRVSSFWSREWSSAFGPVRVQGVRVLPETAGAAAALVGNAALHKRLANDTVALLDFGRLTTNWALLQSGVIVPARTGSVDVGMSAVLQRAAADLGRLTERPQLSDVDVELALLGRRQLLTRGDPPQPVDVAPSVEQAAAQVWPRIEQAVRNSLGDNRGIDLLAVGGGAAVFAPHLATMRGSRQIQIDGDVQMLNAIGLRMAGLSCRRAADKPAAAV